MVKQRASCTFDLPTKTNFGGILPTTEKWYFSISRNSVGR